MVTTLTKIHEGGYIPSKQGFLSTKITLSRSLACYRSVAASPVQWVRSNIFYKKKYNVSPWQFCQFSFPYPLQLFNQFYEKKKKTPTRHRNFLCIHGQ